MKKTPIIAALLFSIFHTSVNAETGDELLAYAASSNKVMNGDQSATKIDYLNSGQFLGFVTGVVELLNAKDFCINPATKKRNLVDKVASFLEENKGKNSIPAGMSISFALGKEYPCTENRRQCILFGGKYCESW